MNFTEWLKQLEELAGTSAVYDGTTSPDFNWWGCPEKYKKKKRKKKGK